MKFSSKSLSAAKSSKALDVIIFLGSEAEIRMKKSLDLLPHDLSKDLEKILRRGKEVLKAGTSLCLPGRDSETPDLVVASFPEENTAFAWLNFARSVLKVGIFPHTEIVGLVLTPQPKERESLIADCFGAAISARIFKMPEFGKRTEKSKDFRLNEVQFFSSKNQQKNLEYGFETGEGGNIVRYLGTLPPNILNPETYGKRIQEIARKNRLGFKFYSNQVLKKMGAGAFTAVDRGNPDSKGGIFELTYRPARPKNKSPLAFVGKGICFDTGGYDIKTQEHMVTMKGDMQGSALAMSALLTAARLKFPLQMKAYLAVTENLISPRAYKADEVVTALNGLSIEVINTDAEGRMVLADTLALASRSKPEMIIDFATLTGTATLAVGTTYSAGFTNRWELHEKIIESGKRSGERVWTFPLEKDFGKALESQIADTLQCMKGRSPDHILAAYFLNQFVGEGIDWVHIDLSAAEHEGGLSHVDSVFTGFGVRWAMEFLKAHFKL